MMLIPVVVVWLKNSSSFPESEKLQFFNTDEFIERTGREEKNDVHAAECRVGER